MKKSKETFTMKDAEEYSDLITSATEIEEKIHSLDQKIEKKILKLLVIYNGIYKEYKMIRKNPHFVPPNDSLSLDDPLSFSSTYYTSAEINITLNDLVNPSAKIEVWKKNKLQDDEKDKNAIMRSKKLSEIERKVSNYRDKLLKEEFGEQKRS